ncbi:MAG: regulatory protein RecX [Christensenellales bacterium]|jgi:regulatory protein
MQCGCPVCGTFMGQVERGSESRCICPNCGFTCDACLGTSSIMPKGSYTMPESFAKELEREEESRKAMNAALHYLTATDRTKSQMERNLSKKGFSEEVVKETIEKLESYGYVDDRDYATRYVKQQVEIKGLGKRTVAGKLYRFGIDSETAQEALSTVDEETERQNALSWAIKFNHRIDEADPRKKREKIVRRLVLKGFSYDVINSALREALSDEDDYC